MCSFSRMIGQLGLREDKAQDVLEDMVEAVAETLKTESTTLKFSEDGQSIDQLTRPSWINLLR